MTDTMNVSTVRSGGRAIRESTRHVNGVATHVRECGQPGPEAIVFVHGNPGSGEDWSDLLGAAGELGYVVAPDMPNYGRSERTLRFACTVEGYAQHLAGRRPPRCGGER
jgi:pimeloyl-ACP methyl ester carboxylesterase